MSVPSFYDISNNYHTPVLGERIAVLGAVENSYTINTGIVSAASRDNGNYFQIDALLNYGNSGGPVINAKGDFLGLAARPLTPSPISAVFFLLAVITQQITFYPLSRTLQVPLIAEYL